MIFQSTTIVMTTSSGKAIQVVVTMKACAQIVQDLWRTITSIMTPPNEQVPGMTMFMIGHQTAEGEVEQTLWGRTIRIAIHRSLADLRLRSQSSRQSRWREQWGRIRPLLCLRLMRINLATYPSRKEKSSQSQKERRTHQTGGRGPLETGRGSFLGMQPAALASLDTKADIP